MRRVLAILLMLLLPIQSVWALVATPCAALRVLAQQAAVVAASSHAADHHGHEMHGLQAHHEHHAAPDGHDPAHHGQGHDAVAAADDAPGHHPAGHALSPGDSGCSGSAACMNLHAPPLAHGTDLGVPALTLPTLQRPAERQRFQSAQLARLQRPPIGLPA